MAVTHLGTNLQLQATGRTDGPKTFVYESPVVSMAGANNVAVYATTTIAPSEADSTLEMFLYVSNSVGGNWHILTTTTVDIKSFGLHRHQHSAQFANAFVKVRIELTIAAQTPTPKTDRAQFDLNINTASL